MKIFILLFLLYMPGNNCLEKSSALDIPGALRPTSSNCSPEESSRLAFTTTHPIHGSRENDILLSLSKNAGYYFYEAIACHQESKHQCNYLSKLLEQTTNQLEYLSRLKSKTNATNKEQQEELEINIFVHKLDACALHIALILVQEKNHPVLNPA